MIVLSATGHVDDAGHVNDVGDDINHGPGESDRYLTTDCDDLNPEVCAFPWPSNLYLLRLELELMGRLLC